MATTIIIGTKMGNANSGNWGHEGRPGKEGGSLPSGKTHGSIPGQGGGAGRAQGTGQAGFSSTKPTTGFTVPVPQLSVPTGTVPEHEEGDTDGKKDYENWYAALKTKPSLADALAMRKYFSDRAQSAEGERAKKKAEERAAASAAREEAEAKKGPVLTPAQKKKQAAEAKKAATAAASAAKKKASADVAAKKKAESEAAKKKKAEEAAAKKKAAATAKPAAKKNTAAASAKKKAEAAQAKTEAAQQKAEAKRQASEKVAESVGLDKDTYSAFQEAVNTLKSGGKLDDNTKKTLQSAGLIQVSGDSVKVASAARSLLSAIQSGDALKAQDAMEKLKKSSSKEYIGQIRVSKAGARWELYI